MKQCPKCGYKVSRKKKPRSIKGKRVDYFLEHEKCLMCDHDKFYIVTIKDSFNRYLFKVICLKCDTFIMFLPWQKEDTWHGFIMENFKGSKEEELFVLELINKVM